MAKISVGITELTANGDSHPDRRLFGRILAQPAFAVGRI